MLSSHKVMEKTKWDRVCQIFIIIVAVGGFMIQSGDVLWVYFEYRTETHVNVFVPYNVSAPDVSLCVRYVDMLRGKFNVSSIDGTTASQEEDEKIRELQSNLTIRQIFEETPKENELIAKCLIRLPNFYRLHDLNASECNKRFNVTKFYTQEYICYRWTFIFTENEDRFRYFDDFTLKNETAYNYQNLAFTLSYPGLIYGIMINYSSVEGADLCKVALNNAERSPVNALGYAPIFYRSVNHTPKYNLINVGYSITQLRKLPSPYNTNCREYKQFEGERKLCRNKCMLDEIMRVFNKVPFSVIKSTPVDMKHMSVADLKNTTATQIMTQITNNCSMQCVRKQCRREFYSASLLKEENGELDYFQIMVYAPKSPTINVTTRPTWPTEEFLIYISTIFGIWFGVSVVSLNPLKLRKWLKKHNNKISVRRISRGLKHSCPCKDCKDTFTPLLYQLQDIKTLLYSTQKELHEGNDFLGTRKVRK